MFSTTQKSSPTRTSKMTTWTTVGLILTFFASAFACEYFVKEESKRNVTLSLSDYITQNYDKAVRPNCGSRTNVSVDFYVVSFGKIEEADMEFSVYLYYRQRWKDNRLKNLVNSSVILSREQISKIWIPVTYCSNAKTSDLMLPDSEVHSSLTLSPDGSLYYSRGAQIVAACYMDLREFPMDLQKCYLKFASYTESDSDLLLSWEKTSIKIENKEMAQFFITKVSLSSNTLSYPSGNFTTLIATFPLERRVGYYVIQTYVPCTFLVMLSWIVFWMSTEETGNRLTVGITTILTIMFLLGYTNGSLPKVSYVKGMDMYLMISFLFIFLSIAECIIVDKYYKREKLLEAKKKKEKQEIENPTKKRLEAFFTQSSPAITRTRLMHTNPSNEENGKLFELSRMHVGKQENSSCQNDPVSEISLPCNNDIPDLNEEEPDMRTRSVAQTVDRVSRFLFPMMWIVYNIIYWKKYIVTDGNNA